MKQLTRITFDPKVMGGKPCIRGLRVTVGTIVGLIASGHSVEKILELYKEAERILKALIDFLERKPRTLDSLSRKVRLISFNKLLNVGKILFSLLYKLIYGHIFIFTMKGEIFIVIDALKISKYLLPGNHTL